MSFSPVLVISFPHSMARSLRISLQMARKDRRLCPSSTGQAKRTTGATQMKNPKQQVSKSRRKFLRDAGISGGIAAVAASTAGVALAESPDSVAEQQKPEQGYRLTDHVLAYYKSAAS
jgi:hypothetical protein